MSAPSSKPRNPRSRANRSQQQVPVGLIVGLLVVVALLLGLGAWVLTRSGSSKPSLVSILVEPAPEVIFINGERTPYPENGEFQLPTGEHLIEVAVPGYDLLEAPIVVEAGQLTSYEYLLEALPGVLTIQANALAQITVDGNEVGQTPIEGIELEPGVHTIFADGGKDFQPLEKEIEIKGYRERQALELELVRSWSWVEVSSTPPGARVFDERDQLVGLAGEPIKVYASSAPYEWTLSGGMAFEPQALSFTVEADQDIDLGHYELDLDHAAIRVESQPHGLPITLNGNITQFKTPHTFSVSPNRSYVLGIRSPYHVEESEKITPEPGRNYDMTFEPTALKGKVYIESVPRGAEVYQGDELLGMAPLELEYEAGEQTFSFQRLGYFEKDAKVIIRPGLDAKLAVTLERQ